MHETGWRAEISAIIAWPVTEYSVVLIGQIAYFNITMPFTSVTENYCMPFAKRIKEGMEGMINLSGVE